MDCSCKAAASHLLLPDRADLADRAGGAEQQPGRPNRPRVEGERERAAGQRGRQRLRPGGADHFAVGVLPRGEHQPLADWRLVHRVDAAHVPVQV